MEADRCAVRSRILTLNHMVQSTAAALDASFAALSDATRRGVIARLGGGNASISSLADTFQMTLTGMKKHVAVLERAGLVETEKVGRVRRCRLGRGGLKTEAEWMEAHLKLFEARFDALDAIVLELKEKDNGRASG